MPTSSSDRNLLFGILALQMDFIDRDQLVDAMSAWVLDKSKKVGDILVEQDYLDSKRHELLEALVCEHLKQHGDDPVKSLGAVSSIGSAGNGLQDIGDADVQQSLNSVARDSQDDPFATRTYAVGDSSSEGQRFRILRPHAKGGIGQLSVALDEELHREVALKELNDHFADDPETRRRFVREAEITGALEHPGIVPIYGLGSYADGRPFYAMRFVRGDSLQNAIEQFHSAESRYRDPSERSLELRQLLGRFVDVCLAIEYAHSRGILHRDLKPGNIMIGRYGETLVVDWGLAKVVDQPERPGQPREPKVTPHCESESGGTRMGTAVGTPAYMSPEQASGLIDELGPASDVYSLGSTLYTLLAGHPPFTDSDLGMVLQKIQKGEFSKPSEVETSVPPALQAICLKAMSLKAEDRYWSPRHLAEDIEHWLADEPVTVYRAPVSDRVLRWARRHRNWFWPGVVSATATIVVSAVLITAAPQSSDLRLGMAVIVSLIVVAIIGGFVLVLVPYGVGIAGRAMWGYFVRKRTPLRHRAGIVGKEEGHQGEGDVDDEEAIFEIERMCEEMLDVMGEIGDRISEQVEGNGPRRRVTLSGVLAVLLCCLAVVPTTSMGLYFFGGDKFSRLGPAVFLLSTAVILVVGIVIAIVDRTR